MQGLQLNTQGSDSVIAFTRTPTANDLSTTELLCTFAVNDTEFFSSVNVCNAGTGDGPQGFKLHTGNDISTTNAKAWRNQVGGSGDMHYDFSNNTTSNSNWITKGYVSYNRSGLAQMNFTGQHRCVPEDPTLYSHTVSYVGMLVESTGRYDSIVEGTGGVHTATINESQPIVTLTKVKKSKRVYGVISEREDDGLDRVFMSDVFASSVGKRNDDRLFINSLGEGGVLVCAQGGHIENGDLLCSSDVEGIAMKQDDDLIHSYTVGKSTQDYTFPEITDPMFSVLIGCVYYCG